MSGHVNLRDSYLRRLVRDAEDRDAREREAGDVARAQAQIIQARERGKYQRRKAREQA
jgi:hypothetical protein